MEVRRVRVRERDGGGFEKKTGERRTKNTVTAFVLHLFWSCITECDVVVDVDVLICLSVLI